jgi:hypothetical protein
VSLAALLSGKPQYMSENALLDGELPTEYPSSHNCNPKVTTDGGANIVSHIPGPRPPAQQAGLHCQT